MVTSHRSPHTASPPDSETLSPVAGPSGLGSPWPRSAAPSAYSCHLRDEEELDFSPGLQPSPVPQSSLPVRRVKIQNYIQPQLRVSWDEKEVCSESTTLFQAPRLTLIP